MQELAPDASVEANTLGDLLHIGADLFTQIGDLVDKGDLGREKGVGCVFDQLRRLDVGEHHRRLDQVQRAVERVQDFAGPVAFGADHHAIGAHEVFDCRAFAQKFGVRGDIEAALRSRPAQDRGNLAAGADGHRRFRDDDRVIGQGMPDFLGGREDIGKIGMAVAAARGGSDRDEYGLGPGDRHR